MVLNGGTQPQLRSDLQSRVRIFATAPITASDHCNSRTNIPLYLFIEIISGKKIQTPKPLICFRFEENVDIFKPLTTVYVKHLSANICGQTETFLQ